MKQNELQSQLNWKIDNGNLHIKLEKVLNQENVSAFWPESEIIQKKETFSKVRIDAESLEICEGIGISFIFHWNKFCEIHSKAFEISGLRKEYQTLLSQFSASDFDMKSESAPSHHFVEDVGVRFDEQVQKAANVIEFIGETVSVMGKAFVNPERIRWKEVLKIMEQTGVDALFIIALIGFLLGLIMSFQSAIPMQRFGAEIFVANLVALSLFRELGPLMTSIILAGRSGSSFAAELGTMKVSEELDALNTMGLNPIQFLVLPRLIAASIITPLLSIFFNFFGLVGSAIVILSFGYPMVTFTNQIARSVSIVDLAGGIFKSYIFGILVAGIGCLFGIRTKEGASAVGESTTGSVVAGIITVCVADGIFSVFFFYLGI